MIETLFEICAVILVAIAAVWLIVKVGKRKCSACDGIGYGVNREGDFEDCSACNGTGEEQ
jgi:uncharacterized membrane protein